MAREYLGLPPHGEPLRLYRNRGDGTFEDATAARSASPASSRRWARTSATSTTTAGSTSTSAPAPRPTRRSCPTACSATTAGRAFVDVTAGDRHRPPAEGARRRRSPTSTTTATRTSFANIGGAFPGDKYAGRAVREPGPRQPLAHAPARRHARQPRRDRRAPPRRGADEAGREAQRVALRHERRLVRRLAARCSTSAWAAARASKRVEIDWPGTRATQTLTGVPTNASIEVIEGEPRFKKLARAGFKLGGAAPASH